MQVARKLLNLHNCFSTLALAEVNAAKLSKNSNKLLAAAHKFGEDVSPSISIGSRPVCGDRGQASSREHQSDNPKQPRQQNPRLLIRTPVLYLPNHSCADTVQKIAEELISSNGYKRVVGLSSSYGKDIVPRLAGKYGVQPITEVIEIVVISP